MEKNRNVEALSLVEGILQNIELAEIPLSQVLMKTLRLARLLGDLDTMAWLKCELSGYSTPPTGVPPEEWQLGLKSQRHYQEADKLGKINTYMHCESVGRIEAEIESAKIQLQSSKDPDISVSSANPYQSVSAPTGNVFERGTLRTSIVKWTSLLDKIRSALYAYIVQTHYQLKFGDMSETIFEKARNRVNQRLLIICPEAVKELISAYENLTSTSESDWSNSANSCRRLLKELADVLFPPVNGKKNVKLSDDAYVNRLIAFIESKSESENFNMMVGSHLKFIGERLDAIVGTSGKGVHRKISREDAERLVIYTYLVAGDILTLVLDADMKKNQASQAETSEESAATKERQKELQKEAV